MRENDFNNDQFTSKNSGFTVPEGYFDRLKSSLLERTSGSGFETPEGYFEALPGRITARLREEAKVIPLTKRYATLIKTASGVAAALVISAGFYFGLKKDQSFDTAQLNTLTDEEIINYIEPTDLNDSRLFEITLINYQEPQKIEIQEEHLIMDEL